MVNKVIYRFENLDALFAYYQYQSTELLAKIIKIIFEDCYPFCNCGKVSKMASVHQGAFAAKKMREREEKIKASLNPLQYNTKFMDSIWGQYNRYSVHNLKKVMDDSIRACLVLPAEKIVPKKNENIFSADIGSSGHFTLNRVYN